jgi:Ca2+-binding RTX toxin-like protein
MILRAAAIGAMVSGVLAVPSPVHAVVVTCHGVVATIVGTERSERLTGTGGRDVIAALGGDDVVDGRGGNDLICGGAGSDHLSGGTGNDAIYGGLDRVRTTDEGTTERIGDVIDGGRGSDELVPGRDPRVADDISPDVASWASSTRGVHIDLASGTITGAGSDLLVGKSVAVIASRYSDVILGSDHSDRIYAEDGPDIVRARGGNDLVSADGAHHHRPATDHIWGGSGDDQLSSREGNDVVRGGSGNDVIDDYAATTDRLYGGSGRDLLVTQLAASGNGQVIDGGADTDRVHLMTTAINVAAQPGSGVWNMTTGHVRLTALGRAFTATVSAFEDLDLSTYGASWTITGTGGADIVHADGTNGTTFTALGGDDRFMGSSSDDTFDGGAGDDRSLGMGEGTDTCISVEAFDYPDCEYLS